jgi:two-component sensor histidine kinase
MGSLALPCLILLIWGWLSWQAERARGAQDALANAGLVREYAMRVLQTQESALSMIEAVLSEAERQALPPGRLDQQLAALSRLPGAPLSAGYVTREGVLTASGRPAPSGVDVSDRPYFAALREAADGAMRVDRQVLQPDEQDVLVFTRRRPGEAFTGLLFATIPIEVFTGFFGRIAAQTGNATALLRRDGLLLIRSRATEPAIQLPPGASLMRAVATADSGIYQARTTTDGVERINGFTRIEGHPLYAVSGIAVSALRRRWLEGLAPVAALLALSALLAFAMVDRAARAIAAEQRHRTAEEARLRADARLAETKREAALHGTLLRELHHRVKNSLALVQSLARLHPAPGGYDRALDRRVLALARVHDLLHVSDFASRLDLAAFLRVLATSPELLDGAPGVTVEVEAEPVEVDIECASPIALIATELLSNAVRHGFPKGRRGHVRVALRAPAGPGGMARLTVADDGIGFAEAPHDLGRHAGLDLARTLAAQIGGTLERRAGPDGKGAEVSVTLPVASPPV